MKNICAVLLAAVLSALLFTQCKKEDDTVYNASFYTPMANVRLYLYLDNVNKGELPYFSKEPECGQQNGDGQQPLITQLRAGEYKIVGKDEQGNVLSEGTLEFRKNYAHLSSGTAGGGTSVHTNGDCMVVGVFY